LSKFIQKQNQDFIQIFLKVSCVYLDQSYETPIRLNSCRSLSRVFGEISSEMISEFLPSIMVGISKLFSIANEDTIHIVIESLDILISKHPECLKYSGSNFLLSLLSTLQTYSKDNLIKIDILYVFESVVRIEGGLKNVNLYLFKELNEQVVPLIVQVISNFEKNEVTLVDSCIELIGIIMDGQVDLDLLKISFLPLMKLLKSTQDENLLQSGTETLRAIIHVSHSVLPQLTFNDSNALQLILEFISKMLHSSSDSACMYVSALVIELIKKLGTVLKDILPNILKVILERLSNSNYIALIRVFHFY
jgi:hypothetical protein